MTSNDESSNSKTGQRVLVREQVTIRDVARALKVSHPTVSRALHGRPGVGEKLTQLIRTKAEELGYVPNRSAQDLRGADTALIGLVIPDLGNDIWGSITRFLAGDLRQRGMNVVLTDSNEDSELELTHVRGLREARMGGIIVAPTIHMKVETLELLRKVPAVQLVRNHKGWDAPLITIDMRSAATQAVQHLHSLGHRRIAYVGMTPQLITGADGLRGFRQAMKNGGMDPKYAISNPGAPRAALGEAVTGELLDKKHRPTAIIYANSELTIGGIAALQARGLRAPEDVSIVAHHDPAWFKLWGPGITTVAMPVKDLAEGASRTLLELTSRPKQTNSSRRRATLVLPPHLIVRGTTAAPP
jgi:DNA-binding LacI/PurR family transcriptional regulator